MLESGAFKLVLGTALGFLSGLGIGGGSLLILWLTMVLGMDPQSARSINLLFFLPAAVIACCFRWRQGALDIKRILPGIAAGCVSAAIFSCLSLGMDVSILRKLFGLVLIGTGLRELTKGN